MHRNVIKPYSRIFKVPNLPKSAVNQVFGAGEKRKDQHDVNKLHLHPE